MKNALSEPAQNPTTIFEYFRSAHATELLTAAVAHFDLFSYFGEGAITRAALKSRLEIEERPFVVLTTALKAMGFLEQDGAPKDESATLDLSALARAHLLPGAEFFVGDYVKLAADAPGVLGMVDRLRSNRPAGSEPDEGGAAYIYRDDIESAMEEEASARFLTMALAGRARNCAPSLARAIPMDSRSVVLDVGGGSGIYSIALLQKNPHLRAMVWERPEVLKVVAEMARDYGVEDRLESLEGDMFADSIPEGADVILLSNVLHDWDTPECENLVSRCADALPSGGELLIHDVFLSDTLDGPLPIALYSASLFTLTEGRAYSAAEYRGWIEAAGLTCSGEIVDTLVHCGVLRATKV